MSLKELRLKRKKQLSKLEAMHKSLEYCIDQNLMVILTKADPTCAASELDTQAILIAAQNLHENTVTLKTLSNPIKRLREEESGYKPKRTNEQKRQASLRQNQ